MQPVAERGGSDQALLRLVRSLPRVEFDFHLAVPAPHPLTADFEAAGAAVHVVRMERISTAHGPATWLRYTLGWPVATWRLWRLARLLDVDLVHSNSLHSWYGWAVARLARVPHVWHAREIVVQSSLALRLERFLCRRFAARVIAVSEAVAAQLDPGNVVVLDEYLDPQEFSPARAGRFRSRAGLPDDAAVVGSVARLDPLKGLDVLLDAFAEVHVTRPDARLLLVGAPVLDREAYAESVRSRVSGLPAVTLLDTRDDVPELIADLDVLVLASVEPEAYGLVLVEALASGVPVVATDHGGPPEIVRRAAPGAGRLVPPGDVGSLTSAVLASLPATTSTAGRRRRPRSFVPTEPGFADVFRWVAGERWATRASRG